jgi:hypothetical protein
MPPRKDSVRPVVERLSQMDEALIEIFKKVITGKEAGLNIDQIFPEVRRQSGLLAANRLQAFEKFPVSLLETLCPLAVAPRTKISLNTTFGLDSVADLSDLIRNGTAALSAAIRSYEKTNSNPDTHPCSKSEDVAECVILTPNSSSQQIRRFDNVVANRFGSSIRLLQNVEARSKKHPQGPIHVFPFCYLSAEISALRSA